MVGLTKCYSAKSPDFDTVDSFWYTECTIEKKVETVNVSKKYQPYQTKQKGQMLWASTTKCFPTYSVFLRLIDP